MNNLPQKRSAEASESEKRSRKEDKEDPEDCIDEEISIPTMNNLPAEASESEEKSPDKEDPIIKEDCIDEVIGKEDYDSDFVSDRSGEGIGESFEADDESFTRKRVDDSYVETDERYGYVCHDGVGVAVMLEIPGRIPAEDDRWWWTPCYDDYLARIKNLDTNKTHPQEIKAQPKPKKIAPPDPRPDGYCSDCGCCGDDCECYF